MPLALLERCFDRAARIAPGATERTWRGRYLRVTPVTPLTFYPEWMVQVAHQGAGAPQVHGGLGRAFARNYVRRNSLEYSGLRGEGSNPVPLPPPMTPPPAFLRQ